MAARVSCELRHTWDRIGQKTCVSRPPTWSSTTISECLLHEVSVFYASQLSEVKKKNSGDFPGDPVVKNLPSSAGDAGLIPGGELRSHRPRGN